MKNYRFYGWETADVPPCDSKYIKISNPRELYDILSEIWCSETCAPRMRDKWSDDNKTLGQCSITAFLAQDIFGGRVYGILRSGGNYHCYNVIGNCIFDLTSEQFGDEELSYDNNPEQFRDVHFAKEEKRLRYEYIKEKLEKNLDNIKYKVKKIYEEDYGCEGIPDGSEPMCRVLIEKLSDNTERWVKISDSWLCKTHIDEGSII